MSQNYTNDQSHEHHLPYGNDGNHGNHGNEVEKTMPLMEHLTELRYRLIISIAAITVGFLIALGFSTKLIEFLKIPLVAVLPKESNPLHFTGPLDVFLASVKVSLLTGFIFTSPVWMFQFWKFLAPGLYDKEKKMMLPFVVGSVTLFLTGLGFCFFIILPLALEFLIGMGQEVGTPMITITDYISLLTIMMLGFGIVFEAPIFLILLAMLELVTAKSLRTYRRHMVVVTLIVGAILTPPDPLSQIGMAIPLYGMYEISIIIIEWIEKRKIRQERAVS